ncbi:MAG: hypothetical protein DHS20C15_10550 [Planctomycetota bacterium]|nr:MAG: hypothetical protein DHS20C15_10550 [Planctomycetota bacterium]
MDVSSGPPEHQAAVRIIAVVTAMGLSRVVEYVASTVRTVRFDGVRMIWGLAALVWLIADIYRESLSGRMTSLPHTLYAFVPFSSIVVGVYLLFPPLMSKPARKEIERRLWHPKSRSRRAFFFFAASPVLWQTLEWTGLYPSADVSLIGATSFYRIMALALCSWMAWSQKEWQHRLVSVIGAGLIMSWIVELAGYEEALRAVAG